MVSDNMTWSWDGTRQGLLCRVGERKQQVPRRPGHSKVQEKASGEGADGPSGAMWTPGAESREAGVSHLDLRGAAGWSHGEGNVDGLGRGET